MKTILKSSLALATLIAVAGFLTSSVGAKGPPSSATAVTVTGGSTADFVATPNSVTTSGFTDFAVNVQIMHNGSATGEFLCAIPGVVVFAAQASNGHVNRDGSVTITGLEYGYDTTIGGFNNCPFTVTLRAGGVGVGGFDYRDESGFFGPGQFDTEVVRIGRIDISH